MSTIVFVDDHHPIRTVFAGRRCGPPGMLIIEAVLSATNGVEIARRLQAAHSEMQALFVSEGAAESLSLEGILPRVLIPCGSLSTPKT